MKKNEALEQKAERAEQRAAQAEQREKDVEKAVENYERHAQEKGLRKADEYIAYYRRSRIQIEKDPAVYAAFEAARKTSKRVQYCWQKYRNSYTSTGRRRWAAKAVKLQERANESWEEAKGIAEQAKFEAKMKRQKAEIKKEINDLLKPHIADFKNFCKIYASLSVEKQAKYREQFREIEKKNKGDIKDMGKHLTRFFGDKKTMEYDRIKDVQEDRRQMNKLANKMLKDAEKSGGDAKDLYEMMAEYDMEQKKKERPSRNGKTPTRAQSAEYEMDADDDYGER